MASESDNSIYQDPSIEDSTPLDPDYVKYYGLFWRKDLIFSDEKILAGVPTGWIGQGSTGKEYEPAKIWVNFWDQKGVYVLYDDGLIPVYAGQAGTRRRNKSSDQESSGGTIGARLSAHKYGKYRNGWRYFSWFGFLESAHKESLRKLRVSTIEEKRDPKWFDQGELRNKKANLNSVLDSFEAILIEAFTPRFNARGGNLKKAVYVNQLEETPSIK